MTEWRRLELVQAARDSLERRVDELEDEVSRLRDMVAALESENYDLGVDLEECRRRHPSTRRQ